jgi:hypothetical protein
MAAHRVERLVFAAEAVGRAGIDHQQRRLVRFSTSASASTVLHQ